MSKLIASATSGTVSSFTISNLNLTKNKLYKLNYHLAAGSVGSGVAFTVNGNNTFANYRRKNTGVSSTSNSNSVNDDYNMIVYGNHSNDNASSAAEVYFKITNEGRFVYFSNGYERTNKGFSQGSSRYTICSSKFLVNTITSVTFTDIFNAGRIYSGSRAEIYEVGELVSEIIVSTNTTEIMFSNLNLSNNREIILVSNIFHTNNQNPSIDLFFNNELDITDYQAQITNAPYVTTSGSMNGVRIFNNQITNLNAKLLSLINITLSQDNNVIYQADSMNEYDGNGSYKRTDGMLTNTLNSITDIKIKASVTDGIAANSKFEIYNLI